ncbi:IPT/TIG domain-containing protein [Methanospirillum sp. J.3.6.1-F.2.7.3]|uniref:IPT/TIG domain-containing protein n=1 Tax=Methanospirillum purgamenti TaxID=2834276 RepID=A0A8E7B0D9_9EURY|nr:MULTISPECIES: IPT/TIG domain-containing protein [Methanospirillum]MDX8549117.1 IPT/TIG domain-containing protein [Methanospirillum hungatei]QVV88793.1 IPT/TIG domain-containing protein [Methanospirillum sp. J.3.6.1-F.2.7.3]
MDYIKQQFLDYKLSTDALWLNNQIGASISQSIRMGTGGATTSGMFGGFSLVSPVGSSGSVMVNPMERSERVHITATGVTQNNPSVFKVIDAPIIDSISPGSLSTTGGSVTLTGSGFGTDEDILHVFLNENEVSESGLTETEFKVTIPEDSKPGIVHIYAKKTLGVKSNEVYLLITDDNPVPVISSLNHAYVVISSGTTNPSGISVSGSGFIDGKSIVFINNEFVEDVDFDVVSSSSITISNLDSYLDKEPVGGTIIPSIVPITVINPQPGGGSASKKLYVLPDSTKIRSPEIWGITPNQGSKDSSLFSEIRIYGAGFSENSIVWWGGDQRILDSYQSGNELKISNFPSFSEPGDILIAVQENGKFSGSIQYLKGDLTPPIDSESYPSSDIPIEKFYIRFDDTGYVTNEYHTPLILNDLLNNYYGIQLYDQYNDISIHIKAIPKIISADYNEENLVGLDPEEASYYVTYQTDLVLDLNQGSNKIMENFVIKSNIQKSTADNNQEIWFDLLNPAYGLNEYIKTPFHFEVSLLNENDQFESEYVLLANTIESGIITNNALGGLEYNSKNYYYRSQQDFIYQNGGVFVEQPDGSYPLVLPPISISRDGDNLVVGITNIPVSGYDTVGGSSQVQVSSTLDSVNTFGLTPGLPNAKSVLLHIDPTTESNWVKWITTLKAICENARSNGVPVAFSRDDDNYDSAWVRIEDDVSGVPMLNIRGGGDENDQDIILDLKTSEFSVSLNPVGKAVSIR